MGINLCPKTIRWCVSFLGDSGKTTGLIAKAESIESTIKDQNRRVYFFGCDESVGHHLYEREWKLNRGYPNSTPFGWIDGKYPPGTIRELQGPACLRIKDGWTILAWWDRSIDKRFGSNAAVIVEGEWSFRSMIELFKLHYPKAYERVNYEITENHGPTAKEEA